MKPLIEVRDTSHKPDEIYGIIERLTPGTKKLELFGRMHNIQVESIFSIQGFLNYFSSQTGSLSATSLKESTFTIKSLFVLFALAIQMDLFVDQRTNLIPS